MATWYVVPSTVETTGVGTRDQPFKCNAINWTPIAAGDTVYLRSALGPYNETLTIGKSGAAENYITIDSDPIDVSAAIIDAENIRDRCITHSAKTYIAIKNIYGKNSSVTNGAVFQPGANWIANKITAENCIYSLSCAGSTNLLIDGLTAIGCEYSLALINATGNITLKNITGTYSEIYGRKNRFLLQCTGSLLLDADGISLDGGGVVTGSYKGLMTLFQGTLLPGSIIKNVRVKNSADNGVYVTNIVGTSTLSGFIVNDNKYTGITFATSSTGITFQDSLVYNNHNDGVVWDTAAHDIKCKRVLSYKNGSDPAFSLSTGGDGFTAHAGNYNIDISFCVAFGNRNTGFAMVQDSAGILNHCTSAYNGDSLVPTARGGLYFDLSAVNPTSGLSWTVKNSISYKDFPKNIFLSTVAKSIVTFDYNSYKAIDDNSFAAIDGGATNISWATYHATYEANSKNEESKVLSNGMIPYDSPCVDAAPWMVGVNDGGQTDPWGKKVYGLPNTGADQGAGMPINMSRSSGFSKHFR